MIIGYARVSTRDQNLDMQIDALKKYGCEKIHQETISGANGKRPVLETLLNDIRSGDILVSWKLDRLGRNLKNFITIFNDLNDRKIGLISLNDPIDTTTPQGKLTFNIFASLAEFERDIIKERTKAGLTAARARGRLGGRPKGLNASAKSKSYAAETLYKEKKYTISEICKQLEISKGTLYAYLKHRGVTVGSYTKNKESL